MTKRGPQQHSPRERQPYIAEEKQPFLTKVGNKIKGAYASTVLGLYLGVGVASGAATGYLLDKIDKYDRKVEVTPGPHGTITRFHKYIADKVRVPIPLVPEHGIIGEVFEHLPEPIRNHLIETGALGGLVAGGYLYRKKRKKAKREALNYIEEHPEIITQAVRKELREEREKSKLEREVDKQMAKVRGGEYSPIIRERGRGGRELIILGGIGLLISLLVFFFKSKAITGNAILEIPSVSILTLAGIFLLLISFLLVSIGIYLKSIKY